MPELHCSETPPLVAERGTVIEGRSNRPPRQRAPVDGASLVSRPSRPSGGEYSTKNVNPWTENDLWFAVPVSMVSLSAPTELVGDFLDARNDWGYFGNCISML